MFCHEEKQKFSLWGAISLNIQGTTHHHHHPHRKSLSIDWGGGGGGALASFFPRGHRIDAFDLWNISEEYRIVSVLLTVAGKRESTYLVCRGEGQGGVWLLNGMALTCVAGICCLTNTHGAVCQRDLWQQLPTHCLILKYVRRVAVHQCTVNSLLRDTSIRWTLPL